MFLILLILLISIDYNANPNPIAFIATSCYNQNMTKDIAVLRCHSGEAVIVDADDLPLLIEHTWYARRYGASLYAYTCFYEEGVRKTVLMHRLLMDPDLNQVVDHIDGIGLDNRRCNLRCCTRSQNAQNRGSRTGGYVGVHENDGRWMAVLMIDGRLTTVARYPSPEEAAMARDSAALFYSGSRPFFRLNFPKEIVIPRSLEDLRAEAKLLPLIGYAKQRGAFGCRGVHVDKKGRLCTHIAIGPRGRSKQHFLGYWRDEKSAALAYDAAVQYFAQVGQFTDVVRLNYPELQTPPTSPEELRRRASAESKTLRTSRFVGVSRYYGGKGWQVGIQVNGKQTHIGVFSGDEAAALAYDAVAKYLHGEKARLNFPGRDLQPKSIQEIQNEMRLAKAAAQGA